MSSKLKRSIVASIIGRTAVGKSSIINALIGEHLSIVSSRTQTTRQLIRAIFNYQDCQIVLIDTPGYQERPKNKLNRLMNRTLTEALANPDMIVWVIDASRYQKSKLSEKRLLEKILIPVFDQVDLPITGVVVFNKIDKLKNINQLLPMLEDFKNSFPNLAKLELIPLSAITKKNINILLKILCQNSKVTSPLFPEDQISDLNERFFAQEFMRESLYDELYQEIPFGCAVTIDSFAKEKTKNKKKELLRIALTIRISSDKHKPIILGENGQRIKRIATKARLKMENFYRTKVYLQTWIKVNPNWQNQPGLLKEFGYL